MAGSQSSISRPILARNCASFIRTPASVLLIFLTGLSEDPPKWKALLILSIVLTPAAYVLFIVLLGIPAPAFAWSF